MRCLMWAGLAAALCSLATAQPGVLRPAPDVLLTGQFRTPLSYDQVLARLDAYYQEQVGRKLAVALPNIAGHVHYETWHDMWITFAPDGSGLAVTMKRATDAATVLMAKGWMLGIAGRTSGELPLKFEELPPLHSIEDRFSGSRRDAARSLRSLESFRLLDTWEHAGLLVSAVPAARVIIEPEGQRGQHRVTIVAETLTGAKQLAVRLSSGATGPCICAVYSETAEIDEELRRDALQKSTDVTATATQSAYQFQMDPRILEERQRAEPATRKRLADASGWFAIRYRVERPYSSVAIRWSELTGYSRDNGHFDAERAMGAGNQPNPRLPAQKTETLNGRLKLGTLPPGAYRIVIEGATAAGEKKTIDQRDFWFNGKTFEEL